MSTEELYEKLTRVDPVTAVKSGYKDRVRLERGMEVFMTTGTPISELKVRAADCSHHQHTTAASEASNVCYPLTTS